MRGRLFAGAAFVALILAAGAASAADVPPPATDAAAPDGHQVTVTLEAGIQASLDIGSPPTFSMSHLAEVDVKFASGFGFTLSTHANGTLPPPIFGLARVEGRLYKTAGAWEFGFSGEAATGIPFGGPFSFEFGPDISYSVDRFTVTNATTFEFFAGLDGWRNSTDLTFNANERVVVMAGVTVSGGGGAVLTTSASVSANITVTPKFVLIPSTSMSFNSISTFFNLGLRAEAPLGILTPYAFVIWAPPTDFLQLGIGVDLEKPLGTGPLSLVGNSQYSAVFVGALPPEHNVQAQIGLRYYTSDAPPP